MSILDEIKKDAEERYKRSVEIGDLYGVYFSRKLILGLEHQKIMIDMLNTIGSKKMSEDLDEKKKEYYVHVLCQNCGLKDCIEIPKGTKVNKSLCPNCLCQSLILNYNKEML
jgi:hypothetical protein